MVKLDVVSIVIQPRSDGEEQRRRDRAAASGPAPVTVDLDVQYQVTLKDGGAERVLTIGIGEAEARAIALATQGVVTPRPMTHDFIADLTRMFQYAAEGFARMGGDGWGGWLVCGGRCRACATSGARGCGLSRLVVVSGGRWPQASGFRSVVAAAGLVRTRPPAGLPRASRRRGAGEPVGRCGR